MELKWAKDILSSHVNSLKALIQQAMEIGIMVEKDSAKAIISYDRRIMRLMMKKLRNFLFSRGKNSSEKRSGK